MLYPNKMYSLYRQMTIYDHLFVQTIHFCLNTTQLFILTVSALDSSNSIKKIRAIVLKRGCGVLGKWSLFHSDYGEVGASWRVSRQHK